MTIAAAAVRRIVTARRFKFPEGRVDGDCLKKHELIANMTFASLVSKIPSLYENIPIPPTVVTDEGQEAIDRQISVYKKTDSLKYHHGSEDLSWWSELAI